MSVSPWSEEVTKQWKLKHFEWKQRHGRVRGTLRLPTLSTPRHMGFEWQVADLATRSTEPTGRFFDLLESITRQIALS